MRKIPTNQTASCNNNQQQDHYNTTPKMKQFIILMSIVFGVLSQCCACNIMNVFIEGDNTNDYDGGGGGGGSGDYYGGYVDAVTVPNKTCSMKREILLLQVLFRHGDRTPVMLYPNDPYINYTFHEGMGQLTNLGKQRMFHYGKALRGRYADYLGQIHHLNIHARSSNAPRCMESTMCVLAGMFPPTQPWSMAGDEESDSESNTLAKIWQPIPVDTRELDRDFLLNPMSKCASASRIDQLGKLPEMMKLLKENENFIEEIKEKTGLKMRNILELLLLFDAIRTEKEYFGASFRQPAWFDTISNNTDEQLKSIMTQTLNILVTSNKQQTALRVAPFIQEIVKNLQKASTLITNEDSDDDSDYDLHGRGKSTKAEEKEVFLYGTHDLHVMYIMKALDLAKDAFLPSYGSGLIFELWRNYVENNGDQEENLSNEPQVSIYYANVTNAYDIYELDLPKSEIFRNHCITTGGGGSSGNVGKHCALESFVKALKNFTVLNIDNECLGKVK